MACSAEFRYNGTGDEETTLQIRPQIPSALGHDADGATARDNTVTNGGGSSDGSRSIGLGPSVFYYAVWSPDSTKLLLLDKSMSIFLLDLSATGVFEDNP